MKEDIRFLQDKYSSAEGKYTYFILAISTSAIGFSIQITKDSHFSNTLLILGIALLCWCLSFYCGCKYVKELNSSVHANIDYLRIISTNPLTYDQKEEFQKNTIKILNAKADKADKYSSLQFRSLTTGGMFFLLWHIVELILRSV